MALFPFGADAKEAIQFLSESRFRQMNGMSAPRQQNDVSAPRPKRVQTGARPIKSQSEASLFKGLPKDVGLATKIALGQMQRNNNIAKALGLGGYNFIPLRVQS